MREDKRIILLAGPSAAGKTTVARLIERIEPRISLVRSATTRQPRGDGQDAEYIYMSREDFLRSVREGGFLEYTEFGENLYGTPAFEIERILSEGGVPLLILDLNGIKALKDSERYSSLAVFLFADEATLDSRLFERLSHKGELTSDAARQYESRRKAARDYVRLVREDGALFDALVDTTKKAPDEVAREILKLLN